MAQQMTRREEQFLTPEQAAERAGGQSLDGLSLAKEWETTGSHVGGHGHWRIRSSDLLAFSLNAQERDKPEDTSWEYSYNEVSTQADSQVLDEKKQAFWRYATWKQHAVSSDEQEGDLPPPPSEQWRVNFLLDLYTLYADDPNHQLTAGELRAALEKVQSLYQGTDSRGGYDDGSTQTS